MNSGSIRYIKVVNKDNNYKTQTDKNGTETDKTTMNTRKEVNEQ
jgi:hypothetical protein